MNSPATAPLNIVVAGGGVAGLEALLALRDLGGDRVSTTLLTPEADFLVRPWTVQEPFARPEAHRYALSQVTSDAGAELRAATLAGVDPAARTVTTGEGETLAYDALVVTLGAAQETAFEHATTFRGRQDGESVHGLLQDVEGGYVSRLAFVVPAGVAWPLPLYELALMTAERARSMSLSNIEIAVITPEAAPLAVFGAAGSDAVAGLLTDAGITLHASTVVEVPDSGTVALGTSGETLAVDRIVA
ncbi:MAG: FAD-dependent oxidoreductase, partial [Solirubrobacteraceae bacterium]|nr:FAD-dependent oxidoreductase [Solirubrobacteraceae bacterium]